MLVTYLLTNRKMFIGGLNWETTDGRFSVPPGVVVWARIATGHGTTEPENGQWLTKRQDGLRAYMAQYGEIDACTIMRDPSGRSRGFAFLTYKSPVSVAKVLGQTHHLDGKQVRNVAYEQNSPSGLVPGSRLQTQTDGYARSTRSERSRAQSTSAQPRSLSEVSPRASPRTASRCSSASSGRSWMRR
jgi:RNA recognition motif-containing protein